MPRPPPARPAPCPFSIFQKRRTRGQRDDGVANRTTLGIVDDVPPLHPRPVRNDRGHVRDRTVSQVRERGEERRENESGGDFPTTRVNYISRVFFRAPKKDRLNVPPVITLFSFLLSLSPHHHHHQHLSLSPSAAPGVLFFRDARADTPRGRVTTSRRSRTRDITTTRSSIASSGDS